MTLAHLIGPILALVGIALNFYFLSRNVIEKLPVLEKRERKFDVVELRAARAIVGRAHTDGIVDSADALPPVTQETQDYRRPLAPIPVPRLCDDCKKLH